MIGEGPDHGIYDVYVNNILWGSPDGYSTVAGERTLVLNMTATKTHTIRIRGRADKNQQSTGRKIGFKLGEGNFSAIVNTYTYDALSRLIFAERAFDESVFDNMDQKVTRWTYAYDVAGNRISSDQQLNIDAGGPNGTEVGYGYNAANQLISSSSFNQAGRATHYTYDAAGRMINKEERTMSQQPSEGDLQTDYVWDRAERLLSTAYDVNNGFIREDHAYTYNGMGQRLSQDVNGTLTTYLLDGQPGLYNVLASTTGPDTTRFVKHANRSLRQQQPSGQWQHLLTDGLGSVRSVLNANLLPLETIHYTPYGAGSPTESLHGFTGEPTDTNGLVHLRARYYDPALGVFPSLDPVEGNPSQPLSLGRYAYVQGNPINAVDPSGLFMEDPNLYGGCQGSGYFNIQPPSTRGCPQGYRAVPIERCINSPDINVSTEAAGTCDGNPALPGIQNTLFDPQNPNRNAGLYGPRITCCQSLTDGSYNYDCSLATVGSRSRNDAAIYDLLDSVEENAGISGAREASRCLESGEALANLRDGYNATGSIVGFELAGFLPIPIISGGGGLISLTDGSGDCNSYLTGEYGLALGIDLVQGIGGAIFTTAQLDHFAGETINISGDINVPDSPFAELVSLALQQTGVMLEIGASLGFSISTDGKCNVTLYVSPFGGPPTISITRAMTVTFGDCGAPNTPFDENGR